MKNLPPIVMTEIEDFFNEYPLRKFKKGQILVLPGETAEHAYLLIKGRLKVYDRSYKGEEIIMDMFKSPAFFPLPLIMNQSPSFLIHEADTDIVVRQAPVDATLEFLHTHPTVVLHLLSLLYRKFDDAFKRMVRLVDSNARARLVHEIIVACHQIGELQEDGSYHLGISQAKLGARVGLVRETVSREMKSLKAKDLVTVNRSYIVVPDIEQLELSLGIRK